MQSRWHSCTEDEVQGPEAIFDEVEAGAACQLPLQGRDHVEEKASSSSSEPLSTSKCSLCSALGEENTSTVQSLWGFGSAPNVPAVHAVPVWDAAFARPHWEM